MNYRTNYLYIKDGKVLKYYVNKACFSGYERDIERLKAEQVVMIILKEYQDVGNQLILSEEKIDAIVYDLRKIGFKFKFEKVKLEKYYGEDASAVFHTFEERDANDYVYAFVFKVSDYEKNTRALLFIWSILRYMYERNYQSVLGKYFRLRKSKKYKRLGIVRKLQLAHAKAHGPYCYGGHNVGLSYTNNKMATIKEFKEKLNTRTPYAQDLFRGKPRKKWIDVYKLTTMSYDELLKYLK